MNINNLNQAFIEIAEKKNQLSKLKKGTKSHIDLQAEIAQLEGNFQFNYGSFIEEALFNVHDEYCPDNEVLKPISYMAAQYPIGANNNYDVEPNAGIPVEADDFPGINARLVLVPSPTRLVLQGVSEPFKETVWVARQSLEA